MGDSNDFVHEIPTMRAVTPSSPAADPGGSGCVANHMHFTPKRAIIHPDRLSLVCRVGPQMNRPALILVSLLAVLAAVEPAAAKSKAFCRDYAERVADRRANGSDVVAGAVIGAVGGAILGSAIGGRHAAGSGAVIGGVGGAVVGGASTSEKWRRVYRRAYAECRAS
jgi:hypothetical protein